MDTAAGARHVRITMASISTRSATRLASTTRRIIPTTRRAFHSYDHPSATSPFGTTEEDILSAAYKHVPEHGFSQRSLGLGARDAGYLDISPSVLSDGTFSLIRYHLVTQRQNLASTSREIFKNNEKIGPGAKVAALTWERLLANRDVIHHWQEVRSQAR